MQKITVRDWRKMSLCPDCGGCPVKGRTSCAACLKLRSAYSVKHRKKAQDECLSAYGGRCTCCGLDIKDYLQFDHIAGGGAKHREKYTLKNISLILRKEGYPDTIQILCANCHLAKTRNGGCTLEAHAGMRKAYKVPKLSGLDKKKDNVAAND